MRTGSGHQGRDDSTVISRLMFSGFGLALEICQSRLEFPAHHLVAIDEQRHDLGEQGLLAAHGPGDGGGVSFGNERELDFVVAFQRLRHLQPQRHIRRWRGLHDLDRAGPGLRTRELVRLAFTGSRSAVG